MISLKTSFNRAAKSAFRIDLMVLLLWVLIIDDERQERDEKARKKRKRKAAQNEAETPRKNCDLRPR